MRKMLLTLTAVLFAAALAGPVYAGEDQLFGLLLGGAAGGLIGNQFGHGSGKVAATTVGVIGGGWIGNDVGRAMDNAGRTTSAAYYTPADPSAYIPSVPNYSSNYAPNYVAPSAPMPDQPMTFSAPGATCRTFSQTMQVNGRPKEIYGTACLQPDGSWRMVQ